MDIKKTLEDFELLLIKKLFEENVVENIINNTKKQANELGIEIDLDVKCKVVSVNLETFHESSKRF